MRENRLFAAGRGGAPAAAGDEVVENDFAFIKCSLTSSIYCPILVRYIIEPSVSLRSARLFRSVRENHRTPH